MTGLRMTRLDTQLQPNHDRVYDIDVRRTP